MLILTPYIVSPPENLITRVLKIETPIINKNPLIKKQVSKLFIQDQNKKIIIKSAQEITNFVNMFYEHKYRTPLPLFIMETLSKSKNNIIEDFGGIFDYQASINNSNGIIKIETDLLYVENKWKKESFAILLNNNLGLTNFTKFVLLHEIGHYLDFISKNQLLQSKQGIDISWNNFVNNIKFDKYFKYWTGSGSEINEYLKRSFQENLADCFACIMLSLNSKQNIIKIVDIIRQARHCNTQGNAINIYATDNSLNRLISNIKVQNFKTPQDIINLVQKSAQEGFILNLKEIFDNSKYNNITNEIIKDNNDNNFYNEIIKSSKKFKL